MFHVGLQRVQLNNDFTVYSQRYLFSVLSLGAAFHFWSPSAVWRLVSFCSILYPFCTGALQKHSFPPISDGHNCLISYYTPLSVQFSQGNECVEVRKTKWSGRSTYWSGHKFYWWLWFENLFQARLSPDTLFGEERWAHIHRRCPHRLLVILCSVCTSAPTFPLAREPCLYSCSLTFILSLWQFLNSFSGS